MTQITFKKKRIQESRGLPFGCRQEQKTVWRVLYWYCNWKVLGKVLGHLLVPGSVQQHLRPLSIEDLESFMYSSGKDNPHFVASTGPHACRAFG